MQFTIHELQIIRVHSCVHLHQTVQDLLVVINC